VRKIRPNEPALLVHTARFIAELRGEPLEKFAAATTANAEKFFGLPEVAE
jgi:TatD DNase family protein